MDLVEIFEFDFVIKRVGFEFGIDLARRFSRFHLWPYTSKKINSQLGVWGHIFTEFLDRAKW